MTNTQEYIRDFTDKAEELAGKKLADCPKMPERLTEVRGMLGEYYLTVGKHPKSYVLELLGSYLLVEVLKNKDVDKVTNTDFPIMSESQLKRRARTQVLMQDTTLDFLNNKLNKQIDSLSKTQPRKVAY